MSLENAFKKEQAKNRAIATKTKIHAVDSHYANRLMQLEIQPKAIDYLEKRRLLNVFPYNVLANELESHLVLDWFEMVSAFLGQMVDDEKAEYEEIKQFVIDTQSKADIRVWTNFDDLEHIERFFYTWKDSQETPPIEE